jgi:hypothetical protein
MWDTLMALCHLTILHCIKLCYAIPTLFVVKIQQWQKAQNFTVTHNFLAFSNTTTDSKFILILSFRRVLNVVCFLLGKSPASVYY